MIAMARKQESQARGLFLSRNPVEDPFLCLVRTFLGRLNHALPFSRIISSPNYYLLSNDTLILTLSRSFDDMHVKHHHSHFQN
jgi:hypothetical protein